MSLSRKKVVLFDIAHVNINVNLASAPVSDLSCQLHDVAVAVPGASKKGLLHVSNTLCTRCRLTVSMATLVSRYSACTSRKDRQYQVLHRASSFEPSPQSDVESMVSVDRRS